MRASCSQLTKARAKIVIPPKAKAHRFAAKRRMGRTLEPLSGVIDGTNPKSWCSPCHRRPHFRLCIRGPNRGTDLPRSAHATTRRCRPHPGAGDCCLRRCLMRGLLRAADQPALRSRYPPQDDQPRIECRPVIRNEFAPPVAADQPHGDYELAAVRRAPLAGLPSRYSGSSPRSARGQLATPRFLG